MKNLILFFLVAITNYSFFQTADTINPIQENEKIVGEWVLDLRPSPDAEPYLQSLIFSDENKESLTGLFYGSPIKDIQINENWDKIYFAFTSYDSSNEYYQTGYIIGNEIFGTTYCPNRNFVMPWSGERKIED